MDVYDRREKFGVVVEIVRDDDPTSPQDNDNAGTIYSWIRAFDGDEQIPEPSYWVYCDEEGDSDETASPGHETWREVTLAEWFAFEYHAALTIPLFFSDHGASGARLYEMESGPNCAIVFTQEEIDENWRERVDPVLVSPASRGLDETVLPGARDYAKARIEELDNYLQGNVWGIVVREPSDEVEGEGTGEILDSCWGYVGDPDAKYIREEADTMAEYAAANLQKEAEEVAHWAARDVVTIS